MSLEIQIQRNIGGRDAGSIVMKLSGSLNTATAPQLEQQLTPVLAGQAKGLVFDLAGLKFISSAGLRLFALAAKKMKERGGQATFVNMQPQIKEVFEIINSLPGVAIFENIEEFDAYIAARQQARLDDM